jgi:hypothetical protein
MIENSTNFRKAIQEAELERNRLVETLKDYEKTRTRIAQLETIIKTWNEYLGEANIKDTSTPQEKLFQDVDVGGEKTHSEAVIEILGAANRALTIKDIVNEFRKRNWKLSDKNGTEVIRRVMLKNHNRFERNTQGKGLKAHYSLKRA